MLGLTACGAAAAAICTAHAQVIHPPVQSKHHRQAGGQSSQGTAQGGALGRVVFLRLSDQVLIDVPHSLEQKFLVHTAIPSCSRAAFSR